MIRKKKGTLKEGTPGRGKGRAVKLDSKPMEAAPPDASVETAPDISMGEQISNLSTIKTVDAFSHAGEGFPIVGIGASAGGLAAFEAFFSAMPPDSDPGMAFVLVQHLDPNHKSILTDLVRRYTRMNVYEVEDGMTVKPNCTYIIPPNRDMALLNGALQLLEQTSHRGMRLPIDFFFRSLAQDQRERAICIVLSGTGSDGTQGIRAIKGEGGMVMAQDPESATYDGMPRSAIATGLTDYVLPPAEMPVQLIAYVAHAFNKMPRPFSFPSPRDTDLLKTSSILFDPAKASWKSGDKGVPKATAAALTDSAKALRKRAEEIFWGKAVGRTEIEESLSPDEVRQMLYELRVHQIELEMQNNELRQTQGELEASRAQYFDLYDLAPVGYCTLSEEGLILEANVTTANMLGVARDALVKQPLTRFVLPEDQDICYRHHKLLFETGTPQVCELRMICADAATCWMRIDAVVLQDAIGVPVCRATMIDITERKRGESALLEREEEYRSLAASVDSMYLMDRNLTYLFMNEGHRVRFGLPLEKIIGRRYGEFHSEENTREFSDCVGEVFKTGKSIIKEHRSERDGVYFLRTFTPFMSRGPVREISKVVIVSKDITGRKQAENDLLKTVQQLQETREMLIQFEKEAAIGRLANGIAHEILNPASIISSHLQFLEKEILSEPAREDVRISREQLQRIVKISQDLLQSSAKKPNVIVGSDLRLAIEEGLQMMEYRIKEDDVHVEYNPPSEVLLVKMETDRVVKVMINLILNACNAMTGNQSKQLTITVHRLEVTSMRPSVRLIVADNGHGIAAGDLDRVFEPFFSTATNEKDTRLGLYVSKGIIREQGGTIYAKNNDRGGASFIVELPLDQA